MNPSWFSGFFALLWLFHHSEGQGYWCYDGSCGPKYWSTLCNSGKVQSPINIIPNTTTRAGPNRTLIFSAEYYEVNEFQMYNTGRAIVIDPYFHNGEPRISDLRVRGAGWNGTFHLTEMRFHWGSEHMVKGNRWPLELQLVHKQEDGDGLGIISILYGITRAPSKVLAPIVTLLSQMTQVSIGARRIPNGLNVSALLPNVWDIFRYNGSLTKPNCDQNVLWSVFTQRMPISQDQADAFGRIRDEWGNVLKKNYRPLQTTLTTERRHIYWMKIDKEKMIENKF